MTGARSLAVLAALAPAAAADVPWAASFEGAFERALEENKVVFVAVNMDGELANERMAYGVYREKSIAGLAASTVNLVASRFEHGSKDRPCKRFGTITCAEHRRVEKEVRAGVVKSDSKGYVIAPQHVFLKPTGEVLLSVTYEIDRSELEWCFVTALLALDPECGVQMPERARPPRRLIMKGVHGSGVSIRPLSKDELEETIRTLRAGFGAIDELDAFNQILATDDPEAVKYAAKELKTGYLSMMFETQQSTLRTIGATSPASFWKAVSPFLEAKGEWLRNEAVVALEQLGAPKSVPVLKSALSKEKSRQVKKNLLRALGAAGATHKGARKELRRYAGGKEPLLRRNALLALAWHAGDAKVDEVLLGALQAEDPLERRAAALALAVGRRTEHRDALQRAEEAQRDLEDAQVMQRALSVLDGANLAAIAADVASVGGDRIPRPRFFGAGDG